MVPSDYVDTIDSHIANDNNTNNCHANRDASNNIAVRFQEFIDVNDPKGPATKPECTKLVYNLSREVAVYCCLSMAVGGVTDSYVLRDDLRCSASKVFDLVLLCKRRLVPLLLSKRLKEEELGDLDRLYRIFAGCLEMLQAEFIRAITLQSMFPLWDTTTLLIQTGVSENISHKKSCNILEPLDASSLQRKMADQDEFSNLERKVIAIQELCYATSQMMDVSPWDCKPDTDYTKIDVEASDLEKEITEQAANHVNTRSPRHRKCIWIVVIVVGSLIIVGGVVGLAVALTKSDR